MFTRNSCYKVAENALASVQSTRKSWRIPSRRFVGTVIHCSEWVDFRKAHFVQAIFLYGRIQYSLFASKICDIYMPLTT